MQRDVHEAALRAAAKVAFSVGVLGGCGGQAAVSTPTSDEPLAVTGGVEPAPAPPAPPPGPTPSGTSRHARGDASAPPQSCDALIAATFPTAGAYPGVSRAVSPEVQQCCVALLLSDPASDDHRWDCCANVPAATVTSPACTPWGPPVPPVMRRRAKAVA